ncbi:hypothetical protein J4856_03140 [Prevotella scopos JCM 17725]|jgi:hypothetical protein|uniref:Histidine kinase n=1 Tax=Prevotella scopos JCM 17725 TaxID=1236518 RepID=A0AAX2F142_9BACT|nr:DUF6029 family protein [Prevotella scopos]ANR73439.1 hypothetical protein AXF22_07915 [Prevotella scopos JCM 17725]QUB44024.1 hypothetical protein J4856_03140 [Prevotella scopos JCM 17725]SHF55174.1 hypothetical protein SAMN05444364_101107 [Prevotella scopos JCM 17725]
MKTYIIAGLLLCVPHMEMWAQENNNEKLNLTGSVQSDVLIPQEDEKTGATKSSGDFLTNTYIDLNATSKYVDAGLRLEYLKHPLPGFENDFKGWGVPNFYVKGRYKTAELTLGTFYEQFGLGFILRTYEERSLGIDNSLLGARLLVKPVKGVTLKVLSGKQRRYWKYNHALVSGGDVELNLDEWFKALKDKTYITVGASFVNKHEGDEDIMTDATHRLNLPHNVNAFDVRASLQHGAFSVLAEYAMKGQDPSFDNGYIYRNGYVAMLSGSYSKRGMSVLLQAKRSVNMAFRSARSMTGTSSFINHLPPFTMEHSYALAALYPYATQPGGEWAYQGVFGYTFPKHTFLGGKYGTSMKLNVSHVHGIRRNEKGGKGSDGYGSAFWAWGPSTYYQDINLQMEKKLSKSVKLNLMYMNQLYNKTVIEGEGGVIHSDIFIADAKFKLASKATLRTEVQYLSTKDDDGDWLFGLAEFSLAPSWMFTISDMYNSGKTNLHYYQGLVTFLKGAHRIQVGYGRTRSGYNCSGGVCRYIPASKGFTLSYNYNF